ncbi:hypothetical protein [Microbispora sp. GKU 823]|uniref:hypothetical protein n=1 Tax=Microbispora sp. GKU 823 TaxID=1652100 RepID=UPI0009A456D9|nr:hypothetical protein [Microbispora sp. GKU 823]OPG12252.1 hypothetical protein B1L11_15550 [Microbispora sp. GKU 823]
MRGGLALAAATVATAALAALPPAATHAAGTRTAGNGDRNGNSTTVRLGNGIRNVSQLTVGSARNGTGIQQRTVGVGGLANAQSGVCRRWSRLCELTQRMHASDRQSDMVSLPEARTRRGTEPAGRRASTASPRRAP